MRNPAVIVISICTALMIGAPAQAQQPGAPAAPLPYGETINLDQSMKIVDAALTHERFEPDDAASRERRQLGKILGYEPAPQPKVDQRLA